MAARTGQQFLAGLLDRRELWVGGERIDSPVHHPALAGAAETVARMFDLQHEAAADCLMPDPETSEPIINGNEHGADNLSSAGRNLGYAHTVPNRTRAYRLVDRFLQEPVDERPKQEREWAH